MTPSVSLDSGTGEPRDEEGFAWGPALSREVGSTWRGERQPPERGAQASFDAEK
jgi:hypothetical protein